MTMVWSLPPLPGGDGGVTISPDIGEVEKGGNVKGYRYVGKGGRVDGGQLSMGDGPGGYHMDMMVLVV
nr:hypothetical protein [Tanacetum cinerariifolium]